MAPTRRAWLALVVFSLVCQILLWRTSTRLDARYRTADLAHPTAELPGPQLLLARDPVEDDDGPGTLLNIDYSGWYFSSPKTHRPFLFVALVLWAGFLFSTIGITASDFFCPNLATVADRLGLGESTAGVTFLAFGNGSPDVFSTFSALKSDSFALAIGELLGASAFITSIVVGSMALIQPFHVPRWPFLRDVGFFTVAVMILVACLKDGKLTLPETGGLVVLYVLYVGIVVGGNWLHGRRKVVDGARDKGITLLGTEGDREDYFSQGATRSDSRRPSTATIDYGNLLKPDDVRDPARSRSSSIGSNVSHSLGPDGSPTLSRQTSSGTINHLVPHHELHRRPPIDAPRPTFSLLGAIEFRDAINALRKESAVAAAAENGRHLVDDGQLSGQLNDLLGEPSLMADYFGPSTPFPSGHYHSFAHGHGHHHLRHGSTRSPSRPGHSRQPSISRIRRPQDEDPTITPNPFLNTSNASLPTQPPRPDARSRIESTPLLTARAPRKAPSINDIRRASADAIQDLRGIRVKNAPIPEGHVREEAAVGMVPSINLEPASADGTTASIPEVEDGSIPLTTNGMPRPQSPGPTETTTLRTLRHVWHILFPALQGFRQKSISGKILGIFASPAILALTVTLPVVDDSAEGVTLNQGGVRLEEDEALTEEGAPYERQNQVERGIVHHSNDVGAEDEQHVAGHAGRDLHRRLLAPGEAPESPVGSTVGVGKYVQDVVDECSESSEEEVLLFNKYLTATQAVLGTLFCSSVIFSENAAGRYIIPLLTTVGACLGIGVLFTAKDGMDPTWRLIRCFAGFFSAMLWIAAIADEVVEILQTFGKILGLSNAIIGLTVFAVGNSCADLISCLTIASFAPNMSYAACFGGPMLNILLGIGGAGSYVILSTGHSYPVHFSPTLWVSAIGLICLLCITLVFIPFNNYCISRKWAIFLYSFYISLTIINIIVEVKGIRI